jgi:hypothetical protein
VTVSEGRVRVHRNGRTLEVGAGEGVEADDQGLERISDADVAQGEAAAPMNLAPGPVRGQPQKPLASSRPPLQDETTPRILLLMYKTGEHENVKAIADQSIERSAAGSDSRCVAYIYAALSRLALQERPPAAELARRFDDECAEHRERFKDERARIAMVLDPQVQVRREAELRDSDDADAVAAHGRFLIGQGQWQAASEWARAALEHETFSDEARCDLRLSLSYAEGKRMGPQAAERLLTEFDHDCPVAASSKWLRMRRRMIAERFGLE